MSRIENIAIFKNTERFYLKDDYLRACTSKTMKEQKVIESSSYLKTSRPGNRNTEVRVSRKRSLEAASSYARMGLKTAVLNFAESVSPGGYAPEGGNAQEDSICRCTNLYTCLNAYDILLNYYAKHKRFPELLGTDDVIYSPDIVVFRSDGDIPELFEEEERYFVDIISCSAPDLRSRNNSFQSWDFFTGMIKVEADQLYAVYKKRMQRILSVAKNTGAEALILGAFGCGSCSVPPQIAASAAKAALDNFIGDFEYVEFAVYCSNADAVNYEVFSEEFKNYNLLSIASSKKKKAEEAKKKKTS